MSAVADVLNGAADLFAREEVKWSQGHISIGCACASTAIGRFTSDGAVFEFFAQHLGWDPSTGDVLGFIFRWNDAPGRTKAEVVAALRAAAERAA